MDCDRLDFLKRDSLLTAPHGSIDIERLLQCVRYEEDKIVYPAEARAALVGFFSAYLNMYTAVYYNPKVKALEHMLTKALFMKDRMLSKHDIDDISEQSIEDILRSAKNDDSEEECIATGIAERIFTGKPYTNSFYIENSSIGRIRYAFLKGLCGGNIKEKMDVAIKKDAGLKDGEFIIIDNYCDDKIKEYDVWIKLQDGVVRVDAFIEMASFADIYRNQHLFRIISDPENHGRIMQAIRPVIDFSDSSIQKLKKEIQNYDLSPPAPISK